MICIFLASKINVFVENWIWICFSAENLALNWFTFFCHLTRFSFLALSNFLKSYASCDAKINSIFNCSHDYYGSCLCDKRKIYINVKYYALIIIQPWYQTLQTAMYVEKMTRKKTKIKCFGELQKKNIMP